MFDLNDIDNIEGADNDCSELEYYASLQKAINSGSAWSFQGSYGLAMMAAIEAGACLLGRDSARDYFGNRIPSRDAVAPGSKGSFDYVADRMGDSYAQTIESI